MASDAQIKANRKNAQNSTGPKTAEGKGLAALNRLRHGFRSQSVVLPGDDRDEYLALLYELTSEFRPQGLIEERCVREMSDAEWRLRRVRAYMESLMAAAMQQHERDPQAGFDAAQALAMQEVAREHPHLSRYETQFSRQFDRAYKQLLEHRKLNPPGRPNPAPEERDVRRGPESGTRPEPAAVSKNSFEKNRGSASRPGSTEGTSGGGDARPMPPPPILDPDHPDFEWGPGDPRHGKRVDGPFIISNPWKD